MSDERSAIRRELLGDRLAADLAGMLRSGSVRPLWRLLAMSWWTTACLTVALTGIGILTPWPRPRRQWLARMARRWARGMGRLVGMRVRIEGPVPQPPFFLVANHLSYVDIVLLMSQVDVVFVAKRELARWPVVGYLTRLVGTIFVDRTSRRDVIRVLDAIDEGMGRGIGVVVFPEGTSSDGGGVSRLRPALFEWAVRSGSPVRVATIRYQTPAGAPPARDVVCWWGEMSFVPHVLELCRLPGFEATLSFEPHGLTAGNRASLAEAARSLMTTRLRSATPSTVENA